jgi:L-ascorbate metabolism protein UlaG (beta-lactamase superfamily)
MNIQYYGHSCFKISTKPAGRGQEEVTIFIDPFDKSIGLRPPQGQADLVMVTHQHFDHNNISALKGEPRVVDIPGEYSVKGVNIIGIQTFHDKKEGAERGLNTAYVIDSEDIRLCHLGDLGDKLNEKQLEMINGVDILMIPIGGNYTIDFKEAVDLIRKMEPKVVIPMHYKMKGTTAKIDDEKKFCNEIGNCPREKISKYNFKKSDLEGKNMEVVLMGIE